MATAGDQINGALRLIGQLAEGEVPSSETSADALSAFNQMVDSWNTENLMIFSTQDQVFTWPANQATRTIGPTGNFVGNRPLVIEDSTYYKDPSTGVSFGVKLVNQQQYNSIALKTSTSTYPQVLFVDMDFPDATLSIFPVPTRALEWHFISGTMLSQPALLATTLSFPPGYLRAFKYNLACEIATDFGIEPPRNVLRIAVVSKRNLKRLNDLSEIMSMPIALVSRRQGYDIYAGND